MLSPPLRLLVRHPMPVLSIEFEYHSIFLQKIPHLFAYMKNSSYLCAVFSPRRGDMSFGWGVNTGHIEKRRLTRFVLAFRNLVNSYNPKHCSTRCPLVCNLMYARNARIGTYGVGYGVAVWIRRQYQSLGMRNSKIAVPLFVCIYTLTSI